MSKLAKPANIENDAFRSAKWDVLTSGRDFPQSDAPPLALLVSWYQVIEQCMDDIGANGGVQVAYQNDMGDIKALPQLSTLHSVQRPIGSGGDRHYPQAWASGVCIRRETGANAADGQIYPFGDGTGRQRASTRPERCLLRGRPSATRTCQLGLHRPAPEAIAHSRERRVWDRDAMPRQPPAWGLGGVVVPRRLGRLAAMRSLNRHKMPIHQRPRCGEIGSGNRHSWHLA